MAAVMKWGSNIVTSDSKTTFTALLARASRGRISAAVINPAVAPRATRRPSIFPSILVSLVLRS
jgi:hypothetical protein